MQAGGLQLADASAFPPTWFLGGERRSQSLRAAEGTPAPEFALADWIGAEPDRSNWEHQVRVVQFVRPELSSSLDQLGKLQAVAGRFNKQGVVFVAVCDARSSKAKMQTIAEEKRLDLPIALDSPAGDGELGIGATANSLGIAFAPTTIVIDRQGVVRVAGLKPDFLDNVLNQLLSEAIPLATPSPTVTPPASTSTPLAATLTPPPASSDVSQAAIAEAGAAQAEIHAEFPDDGRPPMPEPKP
jgi:peroxiredoxin